jgi:putative transport protein
VRGHYDGLIERGEKVAGAEVDEPRSRDVEIQVADVIVGKSEYAGKRPINRSNSP